KAQALLHALGARSACSGVRDRSSLGRSGRGPAVGSEAAAWDLVTHEPDRVLDATKGPGSDIVAFPKRWPGGTFRAMQKRVERPDLPAAEGFEKGLNAIRDYSPMETNPWCSSLANP